MKLAIRMDKKAGEPLEYRANRRVLKEFYQSKPYSMQY
jgi:hypothetical protein